MVIGSQHVLRHSSYCPPTTTAFPATSNFIAFLDKVSRWENRDMFHTVFGFLEKLKQRASRSQERREGEP